MKGAENDKLTIPYDSHTDTMYDPSNAPIVPMPNTDDGH